MAIFFEKKHIVYDIIWKRDGTIFLKD